MTTTKACAVPSAPAVNSERLCRTADGRARVAPADIATGLLAVPVLAGSAAYAIGEARRWPVGLSRQPLEAKAFYLTLAIATIIGMALYFSPINPISALFWSAVINGVVAVPIMVTLMLLASNPSVMQQFVIGRALRILGWLATTAMAASVVGMVVTATI